MGFGAESAHGILGEATRPQPRDRRDRRLPRRSRAGLMRYDVAIVGAGIAGASLAAEAAPHASVLLIEAEDAPGYHATGRSAAFWSETYGGPHIQPLTTASGAADRKSTRLNSSH